MASRPALPRPAGPDQVSLARWGSDSGYDHLTIVFSRVLEDSRCPANALCVWAGNARIELRLASVTQAPASVQLNTFLPPNAAAYGSYRISLLALQPYPGSSPGQPVAPKTYTATLLVTPR
jgi:hypothetical protein